MNRIFGDHELRVGQILKLKEYYTDRLNTLRAKNDDCQPEKTERLRGRIAEAKHILSMCEPSTLQTEESNDTDG